MNYYEELDVSSAASVSEIRRAYKSLARLVHPDQCADGELRRLAELQMTRLNEILGVLTDPEARRRYDASLQAGVARQNSEAAAQPSDRPLRRGWIVALYAWLPPAAVLTLLSAALLYYGTESRQGAPAPASADHFTNQPVAAAPLSPEAPLSVLDTPVAPSSPVRTSPSRPGSSGGELALARVARPRLPDPPPLPAPPSEHDGSLPEPASAVWRSMPEARLPALPDGAGPTAGLSPPSSPGLAGHWYYVPVGRSVPSNGRYLPEYIELHLLESAGVLKGRYVARYRVTDRAIDPNVVFEFEGAGSGPDAQFFWNGPGNARGNVSLRILAPDRLQVSWVATRLSADLNLASGDAQLVRQKER